MQSDMRFLLENFDPKKSDWQMAASVMKKAVRDVNHPAHKIVTEALAHYHYHNTYPESKAKISKEYRKNDTSQLDPKNVEKIVLAGANYMQDHGVSDWPDLTGRAITETRGFFK